MRAALVTIKDLPRSLGPVHITRNEQAGIFMATYSMKASRLDLVTALVDELDEIEQNLMREGYGCGPMGTPLPDWMLQDEPVLGFVPPKLRPYGAPSVQGVDIPAIEIPVYEAWAMSVIESSLQST